MPELAAHLQRVARELAEQLVRQIWPLINENDSITERDAIQPLLAAALAACAREERLDEAKWWKLQIESRIAGINFYQHKNFEVADKIELERIAALERAVGEEASLDPQGGQHES